MVAPDRLDAGDADAVVVSVVIACHDAADTLGAQLEALAAQEFGRRWEVIVVDDASTDASAAVAESYRSRLPALTLVRLDPQRGVAGARNAGVRRARGSQLLFCDADDIVGDGWVAAMNEALRTHDLVAGASDITRLNQPWVRDTREVSQQHGLHRWNSPPYFAHAGGGNLGMTRALYEAVGPFDESPSIRHAEAADYCYRAQLRGYTLHFRPDAVVHVRLRGTPLTLYRQARGWGESSVALHRKFADKGLRRPSLVRGLGSWVVAVPRLARVRNRAQLGRWMYLHGWRVGRLRGSLRNRTFVP